MKYTKRILIILCLIISISVALGTVFCIGCGISLTVCDGSFARAVPEKEQLLRLEVVSSAQKWLGVQEGYTHHKDILRIYNSHEPLARGYAVTVSDNWCATFGSCIAIEQGLTDIIPTECGCERQIYLWQEMGRWQENDNYLPLPGDYIYYNWNNDSPFEENTGWSDHVGIVVGTAGPFIKVIEGNKDDQVSYRILILGNRQIRGYGLPDYASKCA